MRVGPAPLFGALFAGQREVFVSSFSSLLIRLGGLGSTFLLGVVLARALGPRAYGLYGLVISLSAIAMNIALLGTPQLAVRDMAVRSAARDWHGCRTLATRLFVVSGAATMLLGVVALIAAYWFAPAGGPWVELTLLGVGMTAAVGAGALAAAALRGLGFLDKGQFMEIVGRPTAAVIAIGALLGAGYKLSASAALGLQLLVACVAALITGAWLKRALAHNGADSAERVGWHWLKAALPLGLVDVLKQIDGTYGIILVGALASARDLGIYRVALSSSVIAAMPVTILHVVLAPTVSRHYRVGDHGKLQQLLRLASAMMCAALLPMLVLLVSFGRPLVSFIFGAVYADAWLPLAMLCGAQLILGFFGMGPILLAMADSETHLAKIYVLAVIAGLVVAALLIPLWGIAGAAAAQISSTALVATLSYRFARRRLHLGTTFLDRSLPDAGQENERARA